MLRNAIHLSLCPIMASLYQFFSLKAHILLFGQMLNTIRNKKNQIISTLLSYYIKKTQRPHKENPTQGAGGR